MMLIGHINILSSLDKNINRGLYLIMFNMVFLRCTIGFASWDIVPLGLNLYKQASPVDPYIMLKRKLSLLA
jgi:hypothetical protein